MRYPWLFLSFALLTFACKTDAPDAAEVVDVSDVDSDAAVPPVEPVAYSVWNTGTAPESVSINGAVVYVAHLGDAVDPTSKDGDGYIAVYDANGTLVDTLAEGLNAPKGTVVAGRTLFVADVDHLVGINTTTGEKTIDISFEGQTSYLNGLTRGISDVLYVSATDAGKIWRVVPRTKSVEEVAELPGVNGLSYDQKRKAIYAVQYLQDDPTGGHVYLVDAETGAMRQEGDYGGMLDGAMLRGGTFYFTDWAGGGAGKVLALDVATRATRVVAEDEQFSGPANFDVLGDGLALIPMLTGSKVVAVPLGR